MKKYFLIPFSIILISVMFVSTLIASFDYTTPTVDEDHFELVVDIEDFYPDDN